MKKKINLFLIIYIMLGIGLITFLGYKIYKDFFKKTTAPKEEEYISIESYPYTLRKEDTKLYETYFNDLKEVLGKEKIDFEAYAELLAKLFIIDLYTLDNKISSTDIGSLEFIYPSQIENFKLKAEDTIYKYIENNYDGKRKQELPEVKDIIVQEIKESNYKISKSNFDSYEVKVNWEYVKDLSYETEKELIIIKENNKLYIVKGE